MHSMHAINFVLIGAWCVEIFMVKQNHTFLYKDWQKSSICLKLISCDVLNDCKNMQGEDHNESYIMGVSWWTQWLFSQPSLVQLKSCNRGWIYWWRDNMVLCKDSWMLLPYLSSYTEFKFGKAAFLKFSQVMCVPATHTGFT